MEIGQLSNDGEFLIKVPAAGGSRHHTQIEGYEPQLKVRPRILSSEDYYSYDSRQPLVLSSLEEGLGGSSLRSRGRSPWWLYTMVNESKRDIKNRCVVVDVKHGVAHVV